MTTPPDEDPADAKLKAFLVIAVIAGLVGWGLHFLVGESWWRVLLVLIGVPVLLWSVARARDRYMRHVATSQGMVFTAGFPSIPPGSPAHGRSSWGFTGYSMSRQEDDGATLNVYEHSYRWSSRGKTSLAHGVWWQQANASFPEFEVTVRSRLDGLTSALTSLLRGETKEIVFTDDPAFSTRLLVRGKVEAQVRRLFTSQVRQALLADVDRGTVAGKGTVLAWDRPSRLWGRSALMKLMPRSERLRATFTSSACTPSPSS